MTPGNRSDTQTGATEGAPAGLFSFHGGHSLFGDGSGSLEEFAEAALRRGMVFGFSEHMPRPDAYLYPHEGSAAALRERFGRYLAEARHVQTLFQGRAELLVGVELELIPGLEAFLADFLAEFPVDYAVGSVHFVRDIGFDFSPDRYARAVQECGGMEPFCLEYLQTMESMLAAAPFDVLGHFDLFKVFHPEPIRLSRRVLTRVQEVLQRVAGQGLLLDLNARGLQKPCRAIYPSLEILRIAREANVKVTLGDDSHAPSEVGRDLDRVVDHAREAGYSEIWLVGGRRVSI